MTVKTLFGQHRGQLLLSCCGIFPESYNCTTIRFRAKSILGLTVTITEHRVTRRPTTS